MLLTKLFTCACLLAAVYFKESNALIEPLEYLPPDLQGYLDACHSSGDLTQRSARLVFWTSINQYTSKFIKSRPDLSQQQATYLRNSLEDAFAPLYQVSSSPHLGGRVKRQATGRRIRKEIRAMTVPERRRYFSALNALKNDRSLPPNVYDFLAAYHSGDNIRRAHFGPAFPSWHRLYLWILEYFLRLQDPGVSIPYWASVLDNDMQDPTRSVIWSPGFYGNGDGAIRTGPFRNWRQINPQTSFTRNVQDGELYTYDGINRIINQTRNEDILLPTAQPQSDFEIQHGAAHIFVGGSMNNLESATRDPIFFSHHCFVDQIWERFRENQINNNINPETDYPFIESNPRFRPEHRPTANAGFAGLGGARTWTQNLGYINAFSNLVIYDEVPSCPRCANSPYLYCNTNLTPSRCVSRTIEEMRGRRDVFNNIDSTPGGRWRRQVSTIFPDDTSLGVCPKRTFINDVETRWLGTSVLPPAPTSNTMWAYIPVKVVSKRPAEYKQFDKYSLYNQGPSQQLGFKDEFLKQGLQKRYENCEKLQGAVGKITIVSHGLNYEGYSEEYVLTDNRLGVAEANGFIPVKMPTTSGPSEAIIAAFDSCGRVCKPYCKQGSTGAMVADSHFSGGIRVSYGQPKQFADSYTDAMLNIWDIPSQSSCPTLNYERIPVSFFCEYTDTWIWDSATSMSAQSQWPGMASPVQDSHISAGRGGAGISKPGRNRVHRPRQRVDVQFTGSDLAPSIDRYQGRRRGNRRSQRRGWKL
nr:tyrosinase [Cyclina sinensis]